MGLNGRIRRLEDRMPARGRCDVCRGRPGGRIVYTDPADAALAGRDAESATPERCPSCGRAPATVWIDYYEAAPA
jgi:hypothetical protein